MAIKLNIQLYEAIIAAFDSNEPAIVFFAQRKF